MTNSYTELRRATEARDRSLRDKVMSLDEAAALVADGDHFLETGHRDRRRIFNLGYFTWVEQRGVELEDFDRRVDQRFWKGLQDVLPAWDDMIEEFNARTGV